MAQQVRPDEISRILRQSLERFNSEVDVYESGTVLQLGDGIARVHGLQNVMASELLEFPGEVMGMALNLEEDNVGCVLFGDSTHVREGDTVSKFNACDRIKDHQSVEAVGDLLRHFDPTLNPDNLTGFQWHGSTRYRHVPSWRGFGAGNRIAQDQPQRRTSTGGIHGR